MKKTKEIDFLGNEVKEGDYIAFAKNPYANLILGKVVGFTEKGIRVIRRTNEGKWDSKWHGPWNKNYETILPYQFVKIEYKGETNE